MDSLFFNKVAGAVLGSGLLALGLGSLSDVIYHRAAPEKPGFLIATEEHSGGEAAGGETAPATQSLGTLLAAANAEKGAGVAKQCAACHDFTSGGPAKTGPNLYDVVERDMGAAAGFAYSDGLKAMAGQKWTYDSLNTFITAPKEFVKGTKMAFGGVKSATQRADLLAYLATLSAAPKPFPAP
jgi:cytochrome c